MFEQDEHATLTTSLDGHAIELLVTNYFLNQRRQLVKDIQENAFAPRGPVIAAINKAVGDRLSVDNLALDITDPHIKLLGVSLKRQGQSSRVILAVSLACWLNFMIDMGATGHMDVAPWRRYRNKTWGIYKRFVDASLLVLSNRSSGEYDFGLRIAVLGHVAGEMDIELTLESTVHDAFPRPVHLSPKDASRLQLSLDDYSVNWSWIKRLGLVPMGLLEHVVNAQMHKTLHDSRRGWPIVIDRGGQYAQGASAQQSVPDTGSSIVLDSSFDLAALPTFSSPSSPPLEEI